MEPSIDWAGRFVSSFFHGNAEGRPFSFIQFSSFHPLPGYKVSNGRRPTSEQNLQLMKSTNLVLSPVDAAYLAGFIDGDGSIIAQIIERQDYALIKYQIRVTMNITQKNKRKHFLVDIQKLLGNTGTVRDRGDGMSEYALVGATNLHPVLVQLVPFLRVKKKQANLVLKIIEYLRNTKKSDKEKFLVMCELTEQVASLNDSKTRTISIDDVRAAFLKGVDVGDLLSMLA